MNASEDDDETFEQAISQDVGESTQQSAASTTIPIGVCKGTVRDPCDGGVHCVAEFTTETGLLPVVPVLDPFEVELGCSTDEDG